MPIDAGNEVSVLAALNLGFTLNFELETMDKRFSATSAVENAQPTG